MDEQRGRSMSEDSLNLDPEEYEEKIEEINFKVHRRIDPIGALFSYAF